MGKKETGELALPPGLKQAIEFTVGEAVREATKSVLSEFLHNDDVFNLVEMRIAFERCQEKLQKATHEIADIKTNFILASDANEMRKNKIDELTQQVIELQESVRKLLSNSENNDGNGS